jgi:hypothetical protein
MRKVPVRLGPNFEISRQTATRILSLRVSGEMTIDAFWQQAFASALATAREGGASAFRPHAGPKTVLLLARSFGWLISAFHKAEK